MMAAQKRPSSSGTGQRPQLKNQHRQNNTATAGSQGLTKIQNAAKKLLAHDFSVIPTNKADKRPALRSWKPYQKKCMSIDKVQSAFRSGCRLALVGGKVSGNLECLDFDKPDLYKPFMDALEKLKPELGRKLIKRQTPSGGYHLIYRCETQVDGNQKLAVSKDGKKTWIETRGEGGYFLTTPSTGYTVIEHSLKDIPVLTVKEMELLHTLARSFTERPEKTEFTRKATINGTRPGDTYNIRSHLGAILPKYGWKKLSKTSRGGEHWVRPGKDKGTSATLKNGCFYVFSTNAGLPLGPIDAFGVYTHYEHNGDFEAAARELAQRGYGHQTSQITETPEPWEPAPPDWPNLDNKALPGIIGEFVDLATENSEADPAAVLATFLVRFGVEVGNQPFMWVGDTPHRCRLAAVIVGASSKSRKGTSATPVKRLFSTDPHTDAIPPYLLAQTTAGPFSSGEGIIYLVRDEVKKWSDKKQDWVVTDPGVDDKRLFILDEEFAGVMANTRREGNILSMIIRQMWDNGDIAPITKNNRIIVTGAHIGWVSHITMFELDMCLDESSAFNGFANRILWICAKRSKLVPDPERMDERSLSPIRHEILNRVKEFSSLPIEITKNSEASDAWREQYYPVLTKSRPGLVGSVVNRAEAQTLRLAMIYAILDGSPVIKLKHLESGVSFWNYCEQSASVIFHGRQADNVAQQILNKLKDRPMTATDIHKLFSNHVKKERFETAISELLASNLIISGKEKTKGRPIIWYKIKPLRKKLTKQKRGEKGQNDGLNSLNSQSVYFKIGPCPVCNGRDFIQGKNGGFFCAACTSNPPEGIKVIASGESGEISSLSDL